MDLSESLTRFSGFLQENKKSPSTITAYSKDIEQLNAYLRNVKSIEEITTDKLNAYVESLKTDQKNAYTLKTISRKINSMKTFFKFLQSNEIIKADPATDVKHPKYTVSLPRVLTKLEYRALRDTSRCNLRLFTIVELLLQTGMRIGEIARLKLTDLRLEGKKKQIMIKAYASNKERTIEINEEVMVAIRSYLSVRPHTKDGVDAVFVTKTGSPLLVRNIRSSIARAFEKAGIKTATVNDIRNTFIVHQLNNGMPLELVAGIVGHKRLTSTKKYLKLVEKKNNRKINKVLPL